MTVVRVEAKRHSYNNIKLMISEKGISYKANEIATVGELKSALLTDEYTPIVWCPGNLDRNAGKTGLRVDSEKVTYNGKVLDENTPMEEVRKLLKADNIEIINGWAMAIGKPSTKRLIRGEAEQFVNTPNDNLRQIEAPKSKKDQAHALLESFRQNLREQPTENRHTEAYAD